jgi:hypothetical protein
MPVPLIAVLGAAGLGAYLLLRKKAPAATTFPTVAASTTPTFAPAPPAPAATAAATAVTPASVANQDVSDQAIVNAAFNTLVAQQSSAVDQVNQQIQPLPSSALSSTTNFLDPGTGLRVDPSQAPAPISVTEPDTLAQVAAAAADPLGTLFGTP